MQKEQISALEMFLAVEKVCSEYYSLWRTHYGFRSAYHLFSGKLLHLRRIIRKLEDLNSPPAEKLPEVRSKLIKQTYVVSKGLLVFALAHDNQDLIDRLDLLYSDLEDIKDNELLVKCKEIIDEGVRHFSELKTFDVGLSHLAELEQYINYMSMYVGGELSSKAKKDNMEGHLDDLLVEIKDALHGHLDTQALLFKWVNEDFYKQFKEARGIKTVYSVPFQGSVIDDATKMPVGNADITVRELHLTRHISPIGHFRFYNIHPGHYHAVVHKYGYEDEEIEVDVVDGRGTNVEIMMHHI
jgi:hypothetical protein